MGEMPFKIKRASSVPISVVIDTGVNSNHKTSKTIVKQLVSIRMILNVTEYHADVYYNSQTGERVHAAFTCYAYRLYQWQSGNYGAQHQECLAHILRYLKDSMDNEPERTWNKQMRSLIQEMIHFRKGFQSTCH